jgi:hypothetical protein
MRNHPGVCHGIEGDNKRTHGSTGTCELLELSELLCQGHEKLQNVMLSHHMMSTVRLIGVGTGTPESSKRVPIFPFASQGGKQESSFFRQRNSVQAREAQIRLPAG